jgi:hypothetical protein
MSHLFPNTGKIAAVAFAALIVLIAGLPILSVGAGIVA